jgi:DNA-binding response OmpR family regulator
LIYRPLSIERRGRLSRNFSKSHQDGFKKVYGLRDKPTLTSVDTEMKMDFKKIAGNEDWLPVDDYMVKPIDPKELLLKVEKLIGI